MGAFTQFGGTRRVYRLKVWLLGVCVTVGIGFICAGAFTAFAPHSAASGDGTPFILSVFLFGFGAFMILWPLRARVTIEGAQISVRNLVNERSASLSEIEGLRTIQSRNGSYTKLYLKEGRGSITVSKSFNFDDAARAWFAQVADLDQRDRTELLTEISQEQELGATTEERLARLSDAKKWSISLTVASIAAAAAMLFSHGSLRVIAAVVLAAAPAVAFFLMQRTPLLYAILKQKSDPRGELSFALIVPAIGLLLSLNGRHMVTDRPLAPLAVIIFLAFFLGFYHVSSKGPSRGGRLVVLLIFGGLYSAGFAGMADTISDHGTVTAYSTDVLHKRISRGRSTSYYVTLSPWGPVSSPVEIDISSKIFYSLGVGDQVCLSLHPGSLHAPWYEMVDCPDRLISRPVQ